MRNLPMDDRSIETIVFESLGEASTCWIPPPSDQVFDSRQATAIGEELLAEIRSRIVGDRTDELLAERAQLLTIIGNTATDARILLKALSSGGTDAAAGLAERIYERHEPWDVGEEPPDG
jgi:hypothetical protein